MSLYLGIIGEVFPVSPQSELEVLVDKGIENVLKHKSILEDVDNDDTVYIVTTMINKGINKIVYEKAKVNTNWVTIGIDCSDSAIYDNVEPDITIIKEGIFGCENEEFVKNIDALIVIRGTSRDQEKENLAKEKGKFIVKL